jgi:hypothetical protein
MTSQRTHTSPQLVLDRPSDVASRSRSIEGATDRDRRAPSPVWPGSTRRPLPIDAARRPKPCRAHWSEWGGTI